MPKKRRMSSTRMDREISATVGKKLWPVAAKKPRSQAHAAVKKPPPPTPRETICRFCRQPLYWAPDGHFECGGEGEGVCTFWNVISDYDRAGRPADIEGWLDGWIQEAVGTDWASTDERGEHAKAIRNYFKVR